MNVKNEPFKYIAEFEYIDWKDTGMLRKGYRHACSIKKLQQIINKDANWFRTFNGKYNLLNVYEIDFSSTKSVLSQIMIP